MKIRVDERLKIHINKKLLICWFLIAILLIPTTIVAYYSLLLSFVKAIRAIALLYAVYLVVIRRVSLFKNLKYMTVFFIWMTICTLLNGDIYSFISLYYPIVAAVIIYQAAIKVNSIATVKALGFMLMLVAVINLLSWFQGGIYINTEAEFGDDPTVYFIGIRVTISKFALPAIAVVYIARCIGRFKEKISWVVTVASVCAFVIVEWVSTDIVAIAVVFLLLAVWTLLGKGKFYEYVSYALSILLICGGLYLIVNPSFLENFSWLIEGILNKSTTLTGRAAIWESVLSQMNGMDWLVGHGYGSARGFLLSNGNITSSTHSEYLLNLYNYGVIGLILFLVLIFCMFQSVFRYRRSRVSRFITAVIVGLLVTCISSGISETVYFALMWVTVMNLEKYLIGDPTISRNDINKLSSLGKIKI